MRTTRGHWAWLWYVNQWYYLPDWYRQFYWPVEPSPSGLCQGRKSC